MRRWSLESEGQQQSGVRPIEGKGLSDTSEGCANRSEGLDLESEDLTKRSEGGRGVSLALSIKVRG